MLIRAPLLIALASAPAAAQDRGPLELATAPVPPGALRIAYGDDPLQFGELRLPATAGPHPVAIVVHGGCWVARLGELDERAVALDNMRPLAAALTAAGVATWNIEYRRLGHEGGGWPGTFLDVARAADHVRALAAEHRLDLSRVIAIGHSAGGHLAMWLAARTRVPAASELHAPDPLRLVGAMNLDGPADLQRMVPLQDRICGGPVITHLMDGAPDERQERYHATSPLELLPLGAAQVVHAGRMFAEQAELHLSRALEAGDAAEATILPDAGHFVFIDPESEAWRHVLRSVLRLLRMGEASSSEPGGYGAPRRAAATVDRVPHRAPGGTGQRRDPRHARLDPACCRLAFENQRGEPPRPCPATGKTESDMLRRKASQPVDGRPAQLVATALGYPAEERRVTAWIGSSVVIEGNLKSSETLTVAGEVKGDISVPEHDLIIAPQARIQGNVSARFVVVHGNVTGTITAGERIEIGATATVNGDIVTRRLSVVEGATLRGQLGMTALAPSTAVASTPAAR